MVGTYLAIAVALAACVPSAATVVAQDSLPTQGDASAQIDPRNIDAQAEFAFDLLSQTMDAEEGNTVLSPLSVAIALSMTRNGAAGETEAEIAETLRLGDVPLDDANAAYADLLVALADSPDEVTFTIANSLWGQDGMMFEQDFLDANAEYFGAGLRTVDFADTEGAGDAIGQWISDNTEGRIEESPVGVQPSDVMHLINTLYFLADWDNQFSADNTHSDRFTLSDGTEIEVDMLSEERDAEILISDDVEIARMPYVGGEQAAYVVMPPEGESLGEFVEDLEPSQLDGWIDDVEEVELTFKIPKLETEYSVSLKEPLEALGMETAFALGDFSKMTSTENLAISDVGHATYLRVDEEGTEAAAVTDVVVGEMAEAPPPDEFIVNRPYLFIIEDEASGAIVLTAAIEDPRE
jgi:serpin B